MMGRILAAKYTYSPQGGFARFTKCCLTAGLPQQRCIMPPVAEHLCCQPLSCRTAVLGDPAYAKAGKLLRDFECLLEEACCIILHFSARHDALK